MRGWLLDTNVVSELRRPEPNPDVIDFVASQRGEELYVSDVTIAEIVYGIEQLSDAARRADLRSWLENTVRPLFARRVLAITEEAIVRWKAMIVEGRKRGHTFGQPDLFIAAIAALQDLAVVTRDIDEFVEARVPVFNPWTQRFYRDGNETRMRSPVTLEAISSL
ncbi:type II toxin-antitoxin system VapC family toxin [Bradyrhizobium sp. 139]|uniref:type II toxin-antitoxin system VapC family toxin n=1 Tax=Bradyrhizobium sp. 139 TaxID=2782616 RepID=UPI001FF99EF8|nr:type II toxin-antitoxin system VapC family toxin [Bradyrhizobium sp. 139]MCK1740140.1 type II toxin-antitoxin system VapC family toxin [Bradyrhizobium sp. 139]